MKPTTKRLLQSIGKRCFVNCFEAALQKGGSLTFAEMEKADPALAGTSPSAMDTRQAKMEEIFRKGEQCSALQACRTNRMHPDSAEKARRLYGKYCT